MDNMVDVKGEVPIAIRLFIRKKFGDKSLDRWVESLSSEAKNIYSLPIQKTDWFPVRDIVIEPTKVLCDMFYDKDIKGAWESGRFSAEYSLKGIMIVLARLITPEVLITKGTEILSTYYRPSSLEVVEKSRNMVILRITEFQDIDRVIEYRIGGWIQRSGEISGARNVDVKIPKSLSQGDPYTEFYITWR